jgi:hypothetical protein
MRLLPLLLALLAPAPALAGGDAPSPVDEHEFRRLAAEIERLAARNAWAGVERAYAPLADAPFHVGAGVHLAGARAARDRGDLATVRERLRLALDLEDLPEIRDWLARIESAYGAVVLLGDPGRVTLAAAHVPFDPEQAAAIRFAAATIAEAGSFEGLLPEGRYAFGGLDLAVRPGITSARVDLRSDRTLRREERDGRRAAREEGEAPR